MIVYISKKGLEKKTSKGRVHPRYSENNLANTVTKNRPANGKSEKADTETCSITECKNGIISLRNVLLGGPIASLEFVFCGKKKKSFHICVSQG